MLTNFVGGATRLWLFSTDPDSSVHNSFLAYADTGEIFMNTSNQILFFCVQGGMSQTWTQLCYLSQVQALIDAIPQSDWNQTLNTAKDYIKNKPIIPSAQIQSDWNQSNNVLLDYIKNKPSIPSAQIQSDWTQTNNVSLDYIKNKPSALSQSSATRSLNSIFQVSSTRWSSVRYSVDVSTTVSLTGSQIGTVILEMATNSAFTTGVQTIQQFSNGNSGTLVIGLVLTQLNTACLCGDIPPGNYVRLRTVNITGTPTFTYQVGQEVLL